MLLQFLGDMKNRHIFLFVFLAAVLVRLLMNFSIPLIPGIGGGYYPVQIRHILEGGGLAFPDMPLVFYLNALIDKFVLLLFPGMDAGKLIIVVVKIIDSTGLPFLLLPLLWIQKDLFNARFTPLFLFAVAGFAVLSYSPVELTSDAVKNALALAMLSFFIYFFLKFLESGNRKSLVFASLMLLVTGLTHFGVFFLSLCFLITGLIIFYRKKAVIPVIGIFVLGMGLVSAFDPGRARSMLSFWMKAFSIFLSPRLAHYPHGLFNYVFSFTLIGYIIHLLRKRKDEIPEFNRRVLLTIMIFIGILSFPFYGFEFGRRLGLILFVPQSVILILIYPYLKKGVIRTLSIAVLILVIFTTSYRLVNPRPLAITEAAYTDMKTMSAHFVNPENSIVFARHGLEWWVAWEHRVKIASPSVTVDDEMKDKYDNILFLVQEKGENQLYPGGNSIFGRPLPPENSDLVYESVYFKLYKLRED